MKILFLTQLLPYPIDNGGKIKTLAILKTFKNLGHQVFLACFVDKKEGLKYQKELKNICYQIKVFYHPVVTKSNKQLLLKAFLSLFSLKPFAVFKYYKKEMKEFLKKTVKQEKLDVIYIDHLHLAQYFAYVRAGLLHIYDEHNVSSLASWRNFKIEKNLISKLAYFLDAIKWRFYEKKYFPMFDRIFTISLKDRLQLIKLGVNPKKILFLPIPIKPKPLFKFNPKKANILFIGLMSWKPNEDAFWWFYQKAFPLIKKKIPQAKFIVIGANESSKMIKTAKKNESLQVLGFVENIEKFIGETNVFVAPIRSGSGTRIKILTALSFGLPVVSTKIGIEGIMVKNGKEVLIANNAKIFATKVIRIMREEKLAHNLSQVGLEFIYQNYNQKRTQKVLKHL